VSKNDIFLEKMTEQCPNDIIILTDVVAFEESLQLHLPPPSASVILDLEPSNGYDHSYCCHLQP
jgi:hypothetical protein